MSSQPSDWLSAAALTSIYDLSDFACNSAKFHRHAAETGLAPVIDIYPRRRMELKERPALQPTAAAPQAERCQTQFANTLNCQAAA